MTRPRGNYDPDAPLPVWMYREPSQEPRASAGPQRPGAGFALGLMPPLTLAAQYLVMFVLLHVIRGRVLAGPSASPLLGLASGGLGIFELLLSAGGLLIVYVVTQDGFLTIGYFVARWIEGYLLSTLLTASVLASLGLHTQPPHPATPTLPVGGSSATPAPLSNRPTLPSNSAPALPIRATNGQGAVLTITGHTLTITLPGEMPGPHGLVNLTNSVGHLQCTRSSGPSIVFPSDAYGSPASGGYAWQVPADPRTFTSCAGTIFLVHGGPMHLNESSSSLASVPLQPWALGTH